DGAPILAQNGTVKGNISIQVYYPTLVMVMVDEKVVQFFYNGSLNETHLIDSGNSPEMWVPNDSAFEITGIPEGVHDVAILTFVDPYDFNKSTWLKNGPIGGGVQNYVLVMGNGNSSAMELMNQSISKAIVKSISSNSNSSFISKPVASNQLWVVENTAKDKVLNYNVNLGHYYINGNSTDLPFKLVQLLDYKQVPVQYNSTDYAYTSHTTNSEPITVPLSIKTPVSAGPHKLIVLLSINPRQAIDPAGGNAGWEIQGMGWEHVDINVI
ncbi:MAG TPA: hypothetical protein VGK13_03240, partial [Methanocellaceae archaeon]